MTVPVPPLFLDDDVAEKVGALLYVLYEKHQVRWDELPQAVRSQWLEDGRAVLGLVHALSHSPA